MRKVTSLYGALAVARSVAMAEALAAMVVVVVVVAALTTMPIVRYRYKQLNCLSAAA